MECCRRDDHPCDPNVSGTGSPEEGDENPMPFSGTVVRWGEHSNTAWRVVDVAVLSTGHGPWWFPIVPAIATLRIPGPLSTWRQESVDAQEAAETVFISHHLADISSWKGNSPLPLNVFLGARASSRPRFRGPQPDLHLRRGPGL